MTRHKFESIKDKGGLKIHLDGDPEKDVPSTKAIHRGFGYKTYRILRLAGLNITNRARAFNVTFDTMKDWDHNYDEEQQAKREKAEAGLESIVDE